MGKPPIITNEYIRTRKDAANRMKAIGDFDQETAILITVSCDWRIIGEHVLAVGGFSQVNVFLDVLFERIVSDKGKFFLIGHNHSNGNGNPSEADIMVCLKLLTISSLLQIGFLDSIIIPHQKEPVFIRSLYPKIFNKDYEAELEKLYQKYIPRKVRET